MSLFSMRHVFNFNLIVYRILTGCYDNTLHLWTKSGDHHLTIPGHSGPVKDVAWVSLTPTVGSFVR